MQDSFLGLDLIEPLRRALELAGFSTPTPIQLRAVPPALAGRDVMGSAQTGSGKTAAFALPILQWLAKNPRRRVAGAPRALILAPTRELARQIGDVLGQLGRHLPIRALVIYGGVGKRPQVGSLGRGTDILVATPGRLLDLMGEGHLTLRDVTIVVLDEADRMLDMGFVPDVRRILAALPERRQSLFFSATLPDPIIELAETMVREPVRIEIAASVETTPSIDQSLLFVGRENKRALLIHLLRLCAGSRTLVFTRTKHRARNLARQLSTVGLPADSLHGDKSQTARQRALEGFHSGRISILVATDIASRGLDVDDISHVINYELPHEPEVYVHRIGRTARAGKKGTAVSFCDSDEVGQLRDIEELLRTRVPVREDHLYHSAEAAAMRRELDLRRGRRGVFPSDRSSRRTSPGSKRRPKKAAYPSRGRRYRDRAPSTHPAAAE
jgi:ATP-dependent RNA helicase RhlE